MSQHTPEPWKVEYVQGDLYSYRVVSGAEVVVDRVLEPDAHLIAAAPAMLKEAANTLDLIEAWNDYTPEQRISALERIALGARATIALAKGEKA